ncbi:MAG TPA: twin-arginine translocation signal domain-containing protein, partial [Meiothermus sp.]|nr:twin-arginine translocation signal domain-containing protein [Meiothermus sp.]
MNRRKFLSKSALALGTGVLAPQLLSKVLAQQGTQANVPLSLFQEIGKKGGTLTLPLGASPQSFNYFS